MAMKDNPSTTESVAESMYNANKDQCKSAMIVQAYSITVNEQPKVDFTGIENLEKYQTGINEALDIAQEHAKKYLNVIQPAILTNISNIGNYYALHDAVATTLPEGSTEAEWIAALKTLVAESEDYQKAALGIVSQLTSLSYDMSIDSANFRNIVTELNAQVAGDEGTLEGLNDEIRDIQKGIDGMIAGVVLSTLGILGGALMIVIGAVCETITAGQSTALMFGGFGILSGSAIGETTLAMTLKTLNDAKAALITQKSMLKSEVKLATGISQAYESLTNQVGYAVLAANGMSNAWTSLSADLGNMIIDLEKGITSAGEIRTIFLAAANTVIKTVLTDIQIIKAQMSGVGFTVAKKGETVGEAAVAVAEGKIQKSKMLTKSLPSSPPSGALSQSLANLTVAENQIRSITNLPIPAQRIQEESLTNIPRLISQIQSLQSFVAKYVESALPQLDTIETMLANNEPLEKISTKIDSLRKETDSLNTILVPVMGTIGDTIETMYGYPDQLTSIAAGVISQRTKLQGQLNYAESREKAAKKKYYFLIALGPFGVPGLAAALALYLSIKKEVDGYKSQISAINSQIASLNVMITATGQLYTDLGNVTISVTSVKNAVSFVSNDILEIESDLSSKDARIIIAIKVKATITEVKTLAIDAS